MFPLKLDRTRHLAVHRPRAVLLAPLYYAHEREVYERDGMWMTSGSWEAPARRDRRDPQRCATAPSATIHHRRNPFRRRHQRGRPRRGGASRLTERGATRGDDRVSEAAMEDRKREGYF